jgi:hypothetical protein
LRASAAASLHQPGDPQPFRDRLARRDRQRLAQPPALSGVIRPAFSLCVVLGKIAIDGCRALRRQPPVEAGVQRIRVNRATPPAHARPLSAAAQATVALAIFRSKLIAAPRPIGNHVFVI